MMCRVFAGPAGCVPQGKGDTSCYYYCTTTVAITLALPTYALARAKPRGRRAEGGGRMGTHAVCFARLQSRTGATPERNDTPNSDKTQHDSARYGVVNDHKKRKARVVSHKGGGGTVSGTRGRRHKIQIGGRRGASPDGPRESRGLFSQISRAEACLRAGSTMIAKKDTRTRCPKWRYLVHGN